MPAVQSWRSVACAAALGAAWTAFADAPARAGAARPQKAQADLVASAPSRAVGRIVAVRRPATRRDPESSLLRFAMKRLDRDVAYEIWADDPTDVSDVLERVAPLAIEPSRRGRATVAWDTRRGDTLPFAAALEDLGGRRVQVRRSDGTIVLVGTFPAIPDR